MIKKILCFSLLLVSSLASCSFKDTGFRTVKCENYFTLVSDFNHRYPEQDDYMQYLKNGYYETFYDNQQNGYNCHYYLEYKNGEIIDEWGNYTCDGRTFNMNFNHIGIKNPIFSYYHSPTVDFFIIDNLTINGLDYKIVYQARYLYSS